MASFQVADGTGFEMNYEIRQGLAPENILFIHGNLASNRWWMPAEEFWGQKAKGKGWNGSLIYAEFRGCGASSAPREAEVDMHRFADDFISLVRMLNRGKFHLVGHSTGGLIAALMLARAPELFEKAVLLDPVGARGVTFDNNLIAAFEKMKTDRDLTAMVIGSTIHQNDANSDFFQKMIVPDAFAAVKAVGHLVIKALDGLDVRPLMARVSAPVLVLHGEYDTLLPVADSQELAKLIPSARFLSFLGAGHCANIEQPSVFVDQVFSFFFPSPSADTTQ